MAKRLPAPYRRFLAMKQRIEKENTMKRIPETVTVAFYGGEKNLVVGLKVERADGSGVSFTLHPAAASALADQLNALLDDPKDDDMPELTDKERAVFEALNTSAAGNGYDFAFVEDVTRSGLMSRQAIGALLTTLQAKGIITVHEPVTTDSGRWTQVTSDRWNR